MRKIPLERSGIVEKTNFTYICPYRDLDLKVNVMKSNSEYPCILDVFVCQISDQNIW